MKSCILAFVVLVMAVDTAMGLKCYQCSFVRREPSNETKELNGGFDSCETGNVPSPLLLTDCGEGEDLVCEKIYFDGYIFNWIISLRRYGQYTFRGCGTSGWGGKPEVNTCKDFALGSNPFNYWGPGKGRTCLCDTDECNSG